MNSLLALSPLDGRYAGRLDSLRPIFSEQGLMQRRVRVEVEWLIALASTPEVAELTPFTEAEHAALRALASNFGSDAAAAVKAIERTTAHDVKAIEYWLKAEIGRIGLDRAVEFVHFACTSEDINNVSHALMLSDARQDVLLPALRTLTHKLRTIAHALADTPMLTRTHGQSASPSTMGKEFANVCARLERQIDQLQALPLLGKLNGAVGNYNAHLVAYPEVDWPRLGAQTLKTLGVTQNAYTTQIEPHDNIAEYFDVLKRISVIALDLCRDVWGYISLGYFTQRTVAGEVGSSTMPHKVNPIDFENAEGNFGIAIALCTHFGEKLPVSRWQRDLSDSTVLRNLGVAVGHQVLAVASLQTGLGKIEAAPSVMAADLDANLEVLGEAIQTVMRRYGLPQPYERLKALTRGARIDVAQLRTFVDGLELPDAVRCQLRDLRPADYIGLAAQLARAI